MINEQITLKLSRTEYERLLKVVYLGGWLINSHRVDDVKAEYEDLESKVFSYARSAGLDGYAQYDRDADAWFPSREFEEDEEVWELIDAYDDDTFWEDLCWNLAERDLSRQSPARNPEERFTRLCRLRDVYSDEFAAAGLDDLCLVKRRVL